MNRYQLEVAEFDRKHRRLTRGLSLGGAAFLIVAALWSAGLPPTQWWARAQALFEMENLSSQAVPAVKAAGPEHTVVRESEGPLGPSPEAAVSTSDDPQPLLLISTSPGRSAVEGTARIGTDATTPMTYSVGALLLNSACLVEVHKDHVILQRDDKKARLYLLGMSRKPEADVAELLSVAERAPSMPVIEASQSVITEYLRPSPMYDESQLRGYRVYPGRNVGVFANMGLQSDDLILSLDGQALTDGERGLELLNQLTSGATMSALIERKGKLEQLSLDGSYIQRDQEQMNSLATHSSPTAVLAPSPAATSN
jgi:hypothetical protein